MIFFCKGTFLPNRDRPKWTLILTFILSLMNVYVYKVSMGRSQVDFHLLTYMSIHIFGFDVSSKFLQSISASYKNVPNSLLGLLHEIRSFEQLRHF